MHCHILISIADGFSSNFTTAADCPIGTFADMIEEAQRICDRAARRGEEISYGNPEAMDQGRLPLTFATIYGPTTDVEITIVDSGDPI